MVSLYQKISWRVRLLRGALSFWREGCSVDFKSIMREVFSSHRGLRVEFKRLVDPGVGPDGYALLEGGGVSFYLPEYVIPMYASTLLSSVYEEVFVDKVYEGGGCLVRPGDWVVDAGACEGFFSLYALSRGANVLAFEPIPDVAEALKLTLAPYVEEGRARVFQLALGEGRGRSRILLDNSNLVGSTLVDSGRAKEVSSDRSFEVEVASLDELWEEGLIPPVSFIKADVEGYERHLLKGASRVIGELKPRLAISYYHLPDDRRVIPGLIRSLRPDYSLTFNCEVILAW